MKVAGEFVVLRLEVGGFHAPCSCPMVHCTLQPSKHQISSLIPADYSPKPFTRWPRGLTISRGSPGCFPEDSMQERVRESETTGARPHEAAAEAERD